MFNREKIQNDSHFLRDRSAMVGRAKNVVLPNDETELRDGVRYYNKGNNKLTISGGQTGHCGGAVPNGGDVISMRNMSGIVCVEKDDRGVYVKALAGTPVFTFNRILDGKGYDTSDESIKTGQDKPYLFPAEADLSSTIGGAISANRNGIRDFVRSIKVVFSDSTFATINRGEFLADGRIMIFSAGRNYYCFNIPNYDSDGAFGPRISDNMDLIDLFIGSEGIFGVISEAEVYVSDTVSKADTPECGKTNNCRIKDEYGEKAADDLKRIKKILDPNCIFNVGNLV